MAATEVAASKERHEIAVNQDITDDAAEAWAKLLVGSYTPRCADEECRKKVALLGEQFVVREKALQREHPEESSLAIQKMMSAEFGPRFQKLVDDSKKRVAVAGNPNAPPDERLVAMGCRSFLGRSGNWLCYEDAAYEACVRYARGGRAVECRHPPSQRQYPEPGQVASNGGRPAPIHIRPASAPSPKPPIRIGGNPSERLGPLGCKSFLGRKDDFLCTTDTGYDACLAFERNGRVRECRRRGR
jgi:hypothetical protein